MIGKLIKILLGFEIYYKLLEYLYTRALKCMSFGRGADPINSGEIRALNYINQKLQCDKYLNIFDVGANTGRYTILLNKTIKNRAQIFSFEPSEFTFEKLKLNTSNIPNCRTYNLAFGAKEEKSILFSNEKGSELSSLYQRRLDHFHIKMDKTEDIFIHTVDGFCYENKINHIDLLKIDTEGLVVMR